MAITRRKKNMFSSVLLLITFFTVTLGLCSATVYKVGGSHGWSPQVEDHTTWTSLTYHVGDSLVFEYDHNLNDVTQVSGALEYQLCDSYSPKAVYTTGNDVVTFTEPGPYYFITSNYTQCRLGQRLDILVIHDPNSSPIPPPPLANNLLPKEGKIYKVGDLNGWRRYDSEYYYKWSQEKRFNVGDTLLFEYDKEANDVLEISGGLEFQYCDPTSPVSVHKTGYDLVRLSKPGVHYFISSEPGHCASGLKLRVVVGPPLNLPKLSPIDRLKKWLRTFRPHH